MYNVTNKSTQFGYSTPFGMGIPFKLPNTTSENLTDILNNLSRQLYPTGRAWYMQNNGVFNNLHKSINLSSIRLLDDCDYMINSIFPDNYNFNEDDCLLWEYRLGLNSNLLISLEDRKKAILRKMSYPNNIKPRQSKLFIENQLRLAGFDVYIHENRFYEGGEWVYKTPNQIISLSLSDVQHGDDLQHGVGTQHGVSGFDVIANETIVDESFSIGTGNLWATFFIGGENLGEYANIPQNRLIDFKELVLKLKPAHLVAFTFINYV